MASFRSHSTRAARQSRRLCARNGWDGHVERLGSMGQSDHLIYCLYRLGFLVDKFLCFKTSLDESKTRWYSYEGSGKSQQ